MEILVVMRRQPVRVLLRLRNRAARRRQRRSDLDFRQVHGFVRDQIRARSDSQTAWSRGSPRPSSRRYDSSCA